MKIVYNKYIPFKGYKCINLFGVLFVRNGKTLKETDITHEQIHTAQMKEMLYIFFYLWYVLEWLIRLPFYKFDMHKAYKNISFEREAYMFEDITNYPNVRRAYRWFWFLFSKVGV